MPPTVDNRTIVTTGHAAKHLIRLPKPTCSLFQKCFVYLSPKFLNIIPVYFKIINSLSLYKKKLKN